MLLAEKKKQENISEYIIYMYQTEVLIRNFDLDIDKIKTHVVNKIPSESLNAAGKEKLLTWYQDAINNMVQEKLEKEGHLLEVQEIVRQLSDLSLSLQINDEDYRAVFNAARPFIRSSIQASDGLINDPIQACLNGVFGLLMSRMHGLEVPSDLMEAIEHFGNVLSLLSYHYGNSK